MGKKKIIKESKPIIVYKIKIPKSKYWLFVPEFKHDIVKLKNNVLKEKYIIYGWTLKGRESGYNSIEELLRNHMTLIRCYKRRGLPVLIFGGKPRKIK